MTPDQVLGIILVVLFIGNFLHNVLHPDGLLARDRKAKARKDHRR